MKKHQSNSSKYKNSFDTVFSNVSRLTGFAIALAGAWMFVNGDPNAINAAPIADVFIKASQIRTVAAEKEDSLVKPKDKQSSVKDDSN